MPGDIESLDELTSKGVFESRDVEAAIDWWADLTETDEQRAMLAALEEFKAGILRGSAETAWIYGMPLIVSGEAFRDYIRNENEELNEGVNWRSSPFSHIDWEAVAKEARSDFDEIEFNGHTILYKLY